MKKKRSELFSKVAKIGAGAAVAAAVVAGFCAANRNPRESAVVLSSIPENSFSASLEYNSSVVIESSANAEPTLNPETQNSNSDKPYPININTATSRQLQTLSGIGETKAAAIIEYRETHGGFFDVSELLNVSGIGNDIYENIRDHITVGDVPPREAPPESSQLSQAGSPAQAPAEIPVININTASLEEFQLLPGIGQTKAMAIVQYRSVFGDFTDINELKNVNGIGDAVFEGIRDYITVGNVSPSPVQDNTQEPETPEDVYVNLNTASSAELCKIPGIGSVKARAIIEYREENGGFYSIEEIKNVSGIGDKLFESIRGYIYVEYRERPGGYENDDPSPEQPSGSNVNYPVNLNTATLEELCTLPEINEAKAAAIIEYRILYGGFSDIRELQNVNGIGLETVQKLRYIITV